MKVLVTGATGLLGSHVLEQGLKRGHKMIAVVREVSSRTFLSKHAGEIETIKNDLVSAPLKNSAFSGVDAVIHCAALASADPAHQEAMKEINDLAPRRLHALAAASGIKTWVQVSTTAVLTDPTKSVLTESDFGKLRPTPYATSKYSFDKFLLEHSGPMKTLTIHPGYILGRWDSKPSSGAVLFGLRLGRFKHYIETSKNFVAASDVANGLWRALENDQTGRFILGGTNSLVSDFLKTASGDLGVQFNAKEIQADELSSIPEAEQPFVREFCSSAAVSNDKAQRAFNYSPSISISEMIKEAVDYFIENRMLKRANPNGSDSSRI
jgi:dihydroflavonol-4-reductase